MEGLGIVVGGPLHTIGSLAARAEAAGPEHVWLHEAGHPRSPRSAHGTCRSSRTAASCSASAARPDGCQQERRTPRFVTERLVPRVRAALTEADRDRDAFTIATGVIVEADEDRDAARTAARRQVAFYGTTRNYAGVFAVNGHEELTQTCRAHLRDHGAARLHEAVDDDVVDLYAVAGTPAEVREKLAGLQGLAGPRAVDPWA